MNALWLKWFGGPCGKVCATRPGDRVCAQVAAEVFALDPLLA